MWVCKQITLLLPRLTSIVAEFMRNGEVVINVATQLNEGGVEEMSRASGK